MGPPPPVAEPLPLQQAGQRKRPAVNPETQVKGLKSQTPIAEFPKERSDRCFKHSLRSRELREMFVGEPPKRSVLR